MNRIKLKASKPYLMYAVGFFLVVGAVFFGFKLWESHPGPWANAVATTVPVVPVALAIQDHHAEWKDIDDTGYFDQIVTGAGGHWLGSNGTDIPNNRQARLWYDGKFIVEGWGINDEQLSPNGQHFAFVYSNDLEHDEDRDKVSVFVDGRSVIEGIDITLHAVNDKGEVYYSCKQCGEGAGFYRDKSQLITYNDRISEDVFDQNFERCDYLFSAGADVRELFKATLDDEVVGVTCSPNGAHIVTIKLERLFPVGHKNVLYLNGKRVADGNLGEPVVSNQGKLSYLHSDGSARGSLTVNGRSGYTFEGETEGSGGMLYSPSRKHTAILLNGKWWVDGRLTEAGENESVSLDDEAFYIYRFK